MKSLSIPFFLSQFPQIEGLDVSPFETMTGSKLTVTTQRTNFYNETLRLNASVYNDTKKASYLLDHHGMSQTEMGRFQSYIWVNFSYSNGLI